MVLSNTLNLPSIFVIGCLPIMNAPYQSTVISINFESDELEELRTGDPGNGNPVVITDAVSRAGKGAMKAYLNRLKSKNSFRTEATLGGIIGYNEYEVDYWYGFSILLPTDYQPNEPGIWELLAQWHGHPDFKIGETWRNPPLALQIANGHWRIYNRWDTKPNTWVNGEKHYDGIKVWEFNSVLEDKGNWVDWVFHIRWSWQDDGILEIWKNDNLVVARRGPNTFNDELGPYFKMGIYTDWKDRNCCRAGPTEKTIYYDELKVAKGLNAKRGDVDPN